ncbi:hypothetical protein [Lewinella sp. W8]|uniref:hypothetical protein n=1 Tax=Lewinella sp. W8 TaxID=2528208 RepID=UPI001067CCEB|nr:hypothetical protein [Lewinella sp. W8]MTB52026.1 hypothetical protein [Lewinella sp. W8]
MLPKALPGTWRSGPLITIPNYNSNVTNWIDCVFSRGELKLVFHQSSEKEMVLEVHVPVIYGGGGPGHLKLLEKKYPIVGGRVQQPGKTDPWQLSWRGPKLSIFLFGERRFFGRVIPPVQWGN